MSKNIKGLLRGKNLLGKLEECRNEEEAVALLKCENLWGGVVDYPELEELKESYKNSEIEADRILSLSQLDKVAGGVRSAHIFKKELENGGVKKAYRVKKRLDGQNVDVVAILNEEYEDKGNEIENEEEALEHIETLNAYLDKNKEEVNQILVNENTEILQDESEQKDSEEVKVEHKEESPVDEPAPTVEVGEDKNSTTPTQEQAPVEEMEVEAVNEPVHIEEEAPNQKELAPIAEGEGQASEKESVDSETEEESVDSETEDKNESVNIFGTIEKVNRDASEIDIKIQQDKNFALILGNVERPLMFREHSDMITYYLRQTDLTDYIGEANLQNLKDYACIIKEKENFFVRLSQFNKYNARYDHSGKRNVNSDVSSFFEDFTKTNFYKKYTEMVAYFLKKEQSEHKACERIQKRMQIDLKYCDVNAIEVHNFCNTDFQKIFEEYLRILGRRKMFDPKMLIANSNKGATDRDRTHDRQAVNALDEEVMVTKIFFQAACNALVEFNTATNIDRNEVTAANKISDFVEHLLNSYIYSMNDVMIEISNVMKLFVDESISLEKNTEKEEIKRKLEPFVNLLYRAHSMQLASIVQKFQCIKLDNSDNFGIRIGANPIFMPRNEEELKITCFFAIFIDVINDVRRKHITLNATRTISGNLNRNIFG